jgi:hypothetical protein
MGDAVDDFLLKWATDDVRAAIAWLLDNGYTLTDSEVGSSTWHARLVYSGEVELRVVVERAQWLLDISPTPGARPFPYDLLLAAQRDQAYWDCHPDIRPDEKPYQLPPGISWRETLPDVLAWIRTDDIARPVARALDQRFASMWPDSNKAKKLRRTWRANGLPTPPKHP